MQKKQASKKEVIHFQNFLLQVKEEMSKTVVGQFIVLDGLLRAIACDGHVLVEGAPGLAKTLIIKTLATVSGCGATRIQFTADLLPSDILGVSSFAKGRGFEIIKGPIFSHFILADEINRAPPKVQSALLEAMQEGQATIGGKTLKVPDPFFVLATENPLESLGVYPLPEAQKDRFLFKLLIGYPNQEEEKQILKTNITLNRFEDFKVKALLNANKINTLQKFTKEIYLNEDIEKYIVRIIDATRTPEKYNIKLGKYLEWGGSPRASIGLYIAAKADALLAGKHFVVPQNVKNVAHDVLRHRLIINYEGQAENIKADAIIEEVLHKVRVP